MKTQADFIISRDDILAAFRHLIKLEKAVRKSRSTIEITIIDNYIQLVFPGVEFSLKAITNGSAKFTARLWYLKDIVASTRAQQLQFFVSEYQVKLGDLTFAANTTFFETDKILRSISLPINYTIVDIARLWLSNKYTPEEIEFNRLNEEVQLAFNNVKRDIDKATKALNKYGFSKLELETFLLAKLEEGSN